MLNKTLSRFIATSVLITICATVFVASVQAGGAVVWETTSRAELLKGEARGVSVTDTGALMLAPGFAQMFDTEQAYVWSSAVDRSGQSVYLGTGHDGRIFRVTPGKGGALLYDAPELDVTALIVDSDGALYAGTSPDGKVYRIDGSGRAEVYFDPPDKYIWSLAVTSDGALAVGTGEQGRIYRVREKDAKAETALLIDTNETHVISLAADARDGGGRLIAGTDPGGLVLQISTEGKAFALYDSPLREIHKLAVAPDNSIYALALNDAASATRLATAASGSAPGAPPPGATSVTITPIDDAGNPIAAGGASSATQPQSARRSSSDLSTARSAVFRILPGGGTDVLWNSPSITAFAIASSPQGGAVLIGTSDKGRIYSVTNDGRDTLLVQSTEDQISSFVVRGPEVFAASSNAGKLFRLTAEPVGEGTYESVVQDAKFVAAWGRIWWRGGGEAQLQTRAGNTERPDATWSEWSIAYRTPAGANIVSPRARFIQWRAVLKPRGASAGKTNSDGGGGGGGDARVENVSIAYLPRNVAPEVLSITVLPVGVGLQPAIGVPTDPNVEASGLDPTLFGQTAQTPPRRVYQRGAVSLQWQAEDRNNDSMEYAVYYRAVNEKSFHLLKDKMRDPFFTTDGAALADGRYIFRVVASDTPDNPAEQALAGERTGEPLDVDNTPPVVRSSDDGSARNVSAGKPETVAGGRVRLRFTVEDPTGMVKRADVSIDGATWRAAFPDDGIADSPQETYTLDLPLAGTGEHTVSLRAFDASSNVGSTRIVVSR